MSNKAIILINLGSPDSTSVKDLKKYLTEFLMDERVIDVSKLWRNILVKGIIVPFRSPKSAEAYKSIWLKEGSPLIVLTKQLQQAVQAKTSVPVEIAMRYGNPSPKAAYDALLKQNPSLQQVTILPLYPHYAMSSYETAVEYMKEIHQQYGYSFQINFVPPFYNDEKYIHALAESIKPYIDEPYDKILFSYHGIPERHVKKTDPTGCHCLQAQDCCNAPSPAHTFCYRHQTMVTTEMVATQLNISQNKRERTFQSRLGRDQWLLPYTAKRLQELPAEGIKNLLVVCPAFVSDCLETLEEMAEEGKEIFLKAGGEKFTLIPCLNLHPLWVQAVMGLLHENAV